MSDSHSDKPIRRVRYLGRNPRGFDEKYKEHQPEKYPEDVAKVIAAGKTPAGTHRPIMVDEILRVLAPLPGQCALDCTMGYGGHAGAILTAIQPNGRLIGLDVDPIELPKTELRLRSLGYGDDSLRVHRTNFAAIGRIVATDAPNGVQMILADLGLSSMQIDDPTRGFTFKADGPLDMRMNPGRGRSAAALLSQLDATTFSQLMQDNSDEPKSLRIARAILDAHSRVAIETTYALAEIIRADVNSQKQPGADEANDTIRRVFQSLRIAVNDEFSVLDALLSQIPGCLTSGGRVAIMTFHSGEDRRVKNAFKQGYLRGDYSSIADEVTRPSMKEQRDNPRSTSAKLRFAVRS